MSSSDFTYGDPATGKAEVIAEFDPSKFKLDEIAMSHKSNFGRGGILTKCHTSQKIAGIGIPVHIANGQTQDVILKIIRSERIGTRFPPRKLASSFKKYMAHAYEAAKGKVMINEGAKNVLQSDKAHSLLPAGVVQVVGKFKKGDLIQIIDEQKKEVGIGLARYGYKKAKELIGMKNQKPVIHYDHLYLH